MRKIVSLSENEIFLYPQLERMINRLKNSGCIALTQEKMINIMIELLIEQEELENTLIYFQGDFLRSFVSSVEKYVNYLTQKKNMLNS